MPATIIGFFENWLDLAAQYLLYPLFRFLDHGLSLFLLRPMELMGAPISLRIITTAALTAILSLTIRHMLRVREKEKQFLVFLTAKKHDQKQLELLEDWKLKKELYEFSDNEIDEEFNTYIAQRFAQYGLTYLLPIFLTMAWLEHHFPKNLLIEQLGHEHLLPLPPNPWGIDGLNTPALFLITYLCTILFIYITKLILIKPSTVPPAPLAAGKGQPEIN